MERLLPQSEREEGVFEVTIDAADVTISKEVLYRALGYSDNRIDPHFKDIVDHVLAGIHDLCAVRAGYRVLDAHVKADRGEGLVVGRTFITTGCTIAGQLKNAEKAALFLCTIGPGMEAWSRRLFREGDPVRGHFVDTAASLAAEKAAAVLHDHIGLVMAGGGLKVTNRFSPGYCGWPVADQRRLFSFFPENFCGISLTESALMVPVKSVSGMIGIGAHAMRENYSCERCSRKECTASRAYKNSAPT
ncbi:MAG: hypothetical protein JXA18_04475 [Chitinispirillaceae bacterium]|nr:hypothetical protein [Chitinispirillaceae bacterium]